MKNLLKALLIVVFSLSLHMTDKVYSNSLGEQIQHSVQMKKARKLHQVASTNSLSGKMKDNFSGSNVYMEFDPSGRPHGMFYAIEKNGKKERLSGWGVFEDGQPVNIKKFGQDGSSLELRYSLGGRLSQISLESAGKTVTQDFNLPPEKTLRNIEYRPAPKLDPAAARLLEEKLKDDEYVYLKEIIEKIPEKNSGLAEALAKELNLSSAGISKETYQHFQTQIVEKESINSESEIYPSPSRLAENLLESTDYSLNSTNEYEFGSADLSNQAFPDSSAPAIKGRRILRSAGTSSQASHTFSGR